MTMVRALGLMPRHPKVSRQQFHLHWAIVHSRLAEELRAIRHYVQFHGVDESLAPFAQSVYEGMAEAWFDDVPSLVALGTNPHFTEVIKKDEENFLDHSRDGIFVLAESAEDSALTGERSFRKAMLLVKRNPEVRADEFRTWWDAELPDLVHEVPGLARHIRSLPSDEMYASEPPPFDGVLEFWPGAHSAPGNESLSLAGFAAALGVDSPLDIGRTVSLVGDEFRIR